MAKADVTQEDMRRATREVLEASKLHVTPDLSAGGWKVMSGDRRTETRFPTKAKALKRARALAGGERYDQVVVHRRDGSVQVVRSYPYGGDFPPSARPVIQHVGEIRRLSRLAERRASSPSSERRGGGSDAD